MAAWLEATREVYCAGGRMRIARMAASCGAITIARNHGLLEPGFRGKRARHEAVITKKGIDLVEGRLTMYVPYMGHQPNHGRMPGSHRRWKATWLAALPRTNEVRL